MTRVRALSALALVILGCCLGGCATNPDVEQTGRSAVPWGRPADWEGQIPGMGR